MKKKPVFQLHAGGKWWVTGRETSANYLPDLCILAAVSQAECSFKWPVDDTVGGCYLILLFSGHNEWTPKDSGLTTDIKPNSSGRVAPNKNVHDDFEDLPSRRDEPPPYWGWRLLFCVNLRGEALMISLNLHVNGDISLYACQGPAGLPDVKAKSISRPLPSCPSMHFIGTTLSLCSPALFPNELIGKKKGLKKEILLAPTEQVCSRLYHRGCFKVILFRLNINQIRLQLRIIL